jgi:tetraacyldisaccharide 4'-kinase
MGGRGKTPTVALVTRLLLAAGERPAILSRGYARSRPREGAVVVSDGVHVLSDLAESGDEPLMLARELTGAIVVVCDVRAVAARVAADVLGATVHVLDDGFQHRALAREVDIVIVTPEDLDDRRVPFGRLRSPVDALARADAVIVDAEHPEHAISRLRGRVGRIFTMQRRLGRPAPIEPDRGWPATITSVVSLAGIARPERFSRMLTSAGWQVASTVAFPDHHRYTRRDLDRVASAMAAAQADAVLTTEKDAVRLLPLRPLPMPVAAVPLAVAIEPAAEFREWLLARVQAARPS